MSDQIVAAAGPEDERPRFIAWTPTATEARQTRCAGSPLHTTRDSQGVQVEFHITLPSRAPEVPPWVRLSFLLPSPSPAPAS